MDPHLRGDDRTHQAFTKSKNTPGNKKILKIFWRICKPIAFHLLGYVQWKQFSPMYEHYHYSRRRRIFSRSTRSTKYTVCFWIYRARSVKRALICGRNGCRYISPLRAKIFSFLRINALYLQRSFSKIKRFGIYTSSTWERFSCCFWKKRNKSHRSKPWRKNNFSWSGKENYWSNGTFGR